MNYKKLMRLLKGGLNKYYNTSDTVNLKVVNAYKSKIKYLNDFQNGAKLWSYKYNG